ncbi:MAG: hypothetical protein KME60_07080 [Cyanomargarita calcarea GSE-NOS-MK-12-04C]|jgi:hypothetical protein|uniref:Uncharacterized protein n=1 Tax=Cyanomargarita calcarea GSE-NOS-MK-12-04C TaxID=2839659 RepID=A0A951URY8_9CYAN|nr:hypothetical protein [Cyanomargarita calcarea GSE-NOS-MK-12-04C]
MLDSSLWQVHWQGNFQVAVYGNRYVALPPVTIPVEFDQPLIAISTSSFNALPRWSTAGWISQKIYTGLSVDETSDATLINQRVLLNRLSLFEFALNLASSYSITYYFPQWIFDLSIAIWQYTGTYTKSD